MVMVPFSYLNRDDYCTCGGIFARQKSAQRLEDTLFNSKFIISCRPLLIQLCYSWISFCLFSQVYLINIDFSFAYYSLSLSNSFEIISIDLQFLFFCTYDLCISFKWISLIKTFSANDSTTNTIINVNFLIKFLVTS